MIYFIGNQSMIDMPGYIQPATVNDALRYFRDKKSLELDYETDGLCPHVNNIITMQLGDTENQFVLDMRVIDIKLFKELLETKLVLAHNAKFEYKMSRKHGIVIERIYDTQIAEQVIFNGYSNVRFSLEATVKRYLDYEMSKDEQLSFMNMGANALTAKQIKYAADDVAHLHTIAKKQMVRINKYDLKTAVTDEFEAVKAIGDIEFNGMYVNRYKWHALAVENVKKLRQLEREMDDYVISLNIGYSRKGSQLELGLFEDNTTQRKLTVNYASNAQMLDLLRRVGLPINNTQAATLEAYSSNETVKRLLKIRKLAKQISTYGDAFLEHINPVTRRIHTDFTQMKQTFRLGSSNPNIQNIPRNNDYRNCFEPEPGYVWVSVDYSGQEMRLMADFSEEFELINAINNGEDAHCFVGSIMFEKKIEKGDALRTEAKTVNFGKPYGMGPNKLAGKLDSSIQHAKKILKLHETKFPKLDAYLTSQGEYGCANGYVITNPVHKGRRWFPQVKDLARLEHSHPEEVRALLGSIARKAGNLGIQGSGAVMMKRSLVESRRDIVPKFDCKMISTVHDEVNFEVRKDQAEELAKQVAELMERVGNRYVKHVKMVADATITDVWTKS